MADYQYRAVDQHGKGVSGTLVADSELDLDRQLQELGYWVVESTVQSKKKKTVVGSVPRKQLIDFFNGMHAMLSAGITVSDAISTLAEETEQQSFKEILGDICLNVESGNSLDATLEKYPKVFSSQIVNLVRAGEFSGNLATVCADVAEHLEWVDKILADVKQASIYPVMILTAVLGLVFLMFSFVVPRFSKIFDSLQLDLPLLTQVVIDIGDFTISNWYWILMLPVASFFLLKILATRMPVINWYVDTLKLRIPVFGPLNQMIVQSRFSHNMALLTRAGVTLLDSLTLCKGVVNNRVMKKAVSDAEQSVNDGERMTDALRKHWVISPILLRMMVVGEESGKLDEALEHASSRFDREIPRTIKKVFGILEPLIMITLIVIVGLIGGAVFLPMFSLMSGIGG